ncbi:Hypothetical Protein FCC1311_063622 [Hondaea fermentalgiana]|uniref:TLC domain-containing protein n=1 Tax=Hondaea fermentalgiana TaxID=2315210 RepID=A0A2R5GGX7_9STRA|nr:Hypothetical Protein FCC1311_063622 [Hondaea fermentalgiana]|eukprot:GBG30142.1 Hypothetical Protein FCC1311_063622 [Hondaea fermentalgiana]
MLYPKRFLAWSFAKTITQLTIAFLSISFIVKSGFFIPGYYDGTVWSKQSIAWLYLAQGLFEVVDLGTELWMLRRDSSKDHLPWDSIIHHSVSAAYALYIFGWAEELDAAFLGLAVAALSCQVIGPLYTLHRWRFKHRHLALSILITQLGYRTPLAVVSVIRAIQYYKVAPWPHLVIMLCLSYLDYKWLNWAISLYKRRRREKYGFRVVSGKAQASAEAGETRKTQ